MRAGTGFPPPRTPPGKSLVFRPATPPAPLFGPERVRPAGSQPTKIDRGRSAKTLGVPVYVDFLALDSPNAQTLNHLRELADFQRVLGCYPKGA